MCDVDVYRELNTARMTMPLAQEEYVNARTNSVIEHSD